MRIALFVTCLADTLFPDAGRATVRLLERLGHQVEFPAAQTCCGQMHVNTGYLRDALPLVRHYVEVFESCEAIVVPSGSCTGSIRHQHAMVARRYGDEALARRAEAVAARTYELSQLLVDVLGVEDVGAYYPHRVTYHPTCHSLRLLRVGDRPLRLLRNVTGIDLVELPDADTCCGFGGTFAVKNADTSTAMLADKMRSVLDTQAEVCTAGDSSCLMHIGGGLSRLQTGTRTVHLAEILASVPQTPGVASPGAPSAGAARCGPGRCPVSAPTFLGLPTAPRGVGHLRGDDPFPVAARRALADTQLRRNLGKATRTIRAKRAAVVGELPDWEALRDAGQAVKAGAMAHLDRYLEQLEEQVTARGGVVHWARDANEANEIVTSLVRATGATEAVKVKSIVTDEIGLNDALAAAGITAHETDLAELIVQLGHDRPSHILVPAIHRNRAEIRDIFLREMGDVDPGLTDAPAALAEAARLHLRRQFLSAKVGISGANFAIAETGHAVRGRVRGQRPDVPDPAGHPDHRDGHREDPAHLGRPRRVHAAAAAQLHRGADEPVHLDVDRGDPRRRPAAVPPGPAGQRPDRGAGRLRRPPGAALHPLLRVPERLPGVRAGRRARLRLGLPGPDRRGAVPDADRRGRQRLAAVRLLAVRRVLRRLPRQDRHPVAAGPPAGPARGRGGADAPRAEPGGGDHGGRLVGDGQPGPVRGRAASRAGRPAAGPQRPDPPAAAAPVGLDGGPRRAPACRPDLPRMVAE